MSCKLIRNGLLSLLLTGLCAAALANTTAVPAPLHFTANDITVYPESVIEGDSTGSDLAEGSAIMEAVPEPYREVLPPHELPPLVGAPTGPLRVALLLPLQSDALREMAESVRAGFNAARQTDRDPSISVSVIQTGDNPQDILAAYSAALPSHEVIVGPVTRSSVTALANSGLVTKPTLALAQPDEGVRLPAQVLSMGMSLEDEARQVAAWAADEGRTQRAFVIATNSAWQRRVARAFMQEVQSRGGRATLVDVLTAGAYLDPNNLVVLRNRLKQDQPTMIFMALDATQARQVREAIGTEIPQFGTSQVNPLPYQQQEEPERVPFMEGVRLVDMPWQLQPDHTAVMVYPRVPQVPGQQRTANVERFYALGIDAYRIAREIGRGRTSFELDGVSGRLLVYFGGNVSRVERVAVPAAYRDGIVVPLGMQR